MSLQPELEKGNTVQLLVRAPARVRERQYSSAVGPSPRLCQPDRPRNRLGESYPPGSPRLYQNPDRKIGLVNLTHQILQDYFDREITLGNLTRQGGMVPKAISTGPNAKWTWGILPTRLPTRFLKAISTHQLYVSN